MPLKTTIDNLSIVGSIDKKSKVTYESLAQNTSKIALLRKVIDDSVLVL